MKTICHRIANLGLVAALVTTLTSSSSAQTRWDAPDARTRGTSLSQGAGLWQGSDWLGDANQQQSEWQLGLTGENTEVGIRVRTVAPGSAAARARIEPDDVIVNVNGFQVGIVEGRLYDLSEELARRANDRGVVSLVIQDHRSLRLARVSVQLDSSKQTVKGLISYRGRSLPSDAIVTVEIQNVSRPFYQVRHGQTVFRANSASDMPFEIAYDPNYIDSQDVYQVRATVSSGGRILLDARPQRVLTHGNPSSVRLQLQPLTNTGLASGGTTPPIGTGGGNGVVTAGYPNFNRNEVDDRIIAMYRRYLMRDPTFLELAALRSTPGIIERLDQMPLELMAAQEYFDAAGNNNRVWLDAVFREIVKRSPSSTELEQWMQRYASLRYSRTALLQQLYGQVRR